MTAHGILLVYALFLLLRYAWETVLSALNLAHVRAGAAVVPPALAGAIDLDTHARSAAYTLERGRFEILSDAVSTAVFLAVVVSGALGAVDSALRALPLPSSIAGLLLVAAVSAFSWLLELPFSLFSTFSIEARFGFNKTTPKTYILDTLKGLALAVVIGVPVLLGLFWFMSSTGPLWWLWAFCAMAGFELVMNILAPLVIAPLFNKFTPLPEGSLRDGILALASRLGFRTSGIFVMDGSRRSGHSNAYFTGLGRAKRIVLFDTLVAASGDEEILSVLAHEIGHEKKRHLRSRLAVSLALSLLGFWILGLLAHWTPLYHAFGFQQASPAALLVLLAFCSEPFTFFLTPLSSVWSRRHEYQADRYALEAMGSAAGMKSALLRLSRDNLTNLSPHPLYSAWHYSHPTIIERIAALDAGEARRGGNAPV